MLTKSILTNNAIAGFQVVPGVAGHTSNDEIFIRDHHHELSYYFILQEFKLLKIPNENYANAIALVAKGHRKVALDDNEEYQPKFFVKSGRDFVCLPYLASILRLADELDITNIRTPALLTKYYMPNNEISIREWKKHISTTQINFTEDKVVFEVKCADQNNLAALEEQFEKIQNVINYCQKIIRSISNTEDRKFKLNILLIVPNYKFIGFDPKGIKFSFNVQNVVNTFIGEDLYGDELVAIRESLQNSIDSCRYKYSTFKNKYNPYIKVTINNSNIIVSDNGLGMDEFIIENFFARLGSSFYEQEKIKNEFEAIGQFGVGIFSYFLMAEYIDIETKSENSKSLKFRIDKDPKNYFHFFNDSDRQKPGTTITLILKKNFIKKYKSIDYLNYIKAIFIHIEFPIFIEINDEIIELNSKPFIKSSEIEIEKRINILHKNKINKYQTISHKINNDDYEGELSLIINKFTNKYSLKNTSKMFNNEMRQMNRDSPIEISQKGVSVEEYPSGMLRMVFGGINLKKSLKISINRKEFKDRDKINQIISVFTAGLIDKLFIELRSRFSGDIFYRLCEELLSDYVRPDYYKLFASTDFQKAIIDNVAIKVVEGSIEKHITIKKINENINKVMLLSKTDNNESIINNTKLPSIISSARENYRSYRVTRSILIEFCKYTPSVIFDGTRYYNIFTKDDNYEKYLSNKINMSMYSNYYQVACEEINSDVLAINMIHSMYDMPKNVMYIDDFIINSNHPYIKYIFKNNETIKNDNDMLEIIKISIEIIFSLCMQRKILKKILKKELKNLNSLFEHIEGGEIPWVFSMSDFQISGK